MLKIARLSVACAIVILILFAGGPAASAQCASPPCLPLQSYGGPVLESFTIYPLYLGNGQNTQMNPVITPALCAFEEKRDK